MKFFASEKCFVETLQEVWGWGVTSHPFYLHVLHLIQSFILFCPSVCWAHHLASGNSNCWVICLCNDPLLEINLRTLLRPKRLLFCFKKWVLVGFFFKFTLVILFEVNFLSWFSKRLGKHYFQKPWICCVIPCNNGCAPDNGEIKQVSWPFVNNLPTWKYGCKSWRWVWQVIWARKAAL